MVKRYNIMSEDLKKAALDYHANPRPGKISVEITKPTATSRDLALAYSPGVASLLEKLRQILKMHISIRLREIWLLSFLMVQQFLV